MPVPAHSGRIARRRPANGSRAPRAWVSRAFAPSSRARSQPTRNTFDGIALGDTWRHPHAGGTGATAGWVPFHKLSQWLAYSLFEPFEWAGITVTDRDQLTALPEYRNGGLLLDAGVLQLIDAADGARTWQVGDELVVEWRALTVALIDELAPRIRARLAAPTLPLACILEGG